ncbi:hypothetical protein MTP99_017750 [Tenebrio molitor]|jgi:hypothetical protein|nr:hypothetical protein MTP99_017750 [Tenebrio molitor]
MTHRGDEETSWAAVPITISLFLGEISGNGLLNFFMDTIMPDDILRLCRPNFVEIEIVFRSYLVPVDVLHPSRVRVRGPPTEAPQDRTTPKTPLYEAPPHCAPLSLCYCNILSTAPPGSLLLFLDDSSQDVCEF